MAVVTELKQMEAARVEEIDGQLVSDNGQIRVVLSRQPTAATFESGGHWIRSLPGTVKYLDPVTGMEDVLYEASRTDAFVQRGYHICLDSSFPLVDEQYIVEAGSLKHNINLRYGLRDPFPFLEEPWLAVAGVIEFDPSLSLLVDGETPTGQFSTAGSVYLVNRAGEVVFELPPVIAWDQGDAVIGGRYDGAVLEPGRMDLATCVPASWLSDPSRAYPVIIDPTTVSTNASSYYQSNEVHRTNEDVRVVFLSEGGDLRNQFALFSRDKGQTWTKQAIPASPMDNSTSAKTARVIRAAYDYSRGLFWLVHFALQTYAYTSARWNATTNQFDFGAWRQPPSSSYYWSTLSDGGHGDIAVSPAGEIVLAYVHTTSATNGYSRAQIITATGATAFDAAWTYVARSAALNTSTSAFSFHCQVEHDPYNNKFWVLGGVGESQYLYLLKNLTVSSSTNIQAEQTPATAAVAGGFIILDANRMIIMGRRLANLMAVQRTGGTGAGTFGTTYSSTYVMRSSTYSSFAHICKIGNQARLYFIDPDAALVEVKISNDGQEQSRRVIATSGTTNSDSLIAPFGERSTDTDLSLMWSKGLSAPNTYYHELIADNRPPLAPSNIVRSNFDATQAAEVTYQYNDPDAGDGLTAHEVEIYDTADPATRVWHLPKTGTTTAVFTIPAYTLQDGHTYQVRIRTYDRAGLESPWSDWAMFKCSTPPVATITAPAVEGTITTNEFTFTGSYVHPSGLLQKSYRFQLISGDGSTLVQDGPEVIGTANLYTFRNLENNTDYIIKLTVTSQEDVTATDYVPFSVRYTPPPTPTAVASNDWERACVVVDFANGLPDEGQPDAAKNNVYRRMKKWNGWTDWVLLQEGADSPFIDYTAPVGHFEYGVTAVSEGGATSDRGIAAVDVMYFGHWLIDEERPGESINFLYNSGGDDSELRQAAQVEESFAELPTMTKGQTKYRTGTLKAVQLANGRQALDFVLDKIEEMATSNKLYLLKLTSGRAYRVGLSELRDPHQYGNRKAEISVRWTALGKVIL